MEGLILFVFSAIFITNVLTMDMHPAETNLAWKRCLDMQLQPNFDANLVIGAPWRIFYTWELKYGSKCVDIAFKNATKGIVSRFHDDIGEKLLYQPDWDAASLLVWMGDVSHEMLLISEDVPGTFSGVPNIARKPSNSLTDETIKEKTLLNRYFLKILDNKNYMLWADCLISVSMLLVKRPHTPHRADIASIVNYLELGTGFHACTEEEKIIGAKSLNITKFY